MEGGVGLQEVRTSALARLQRWGLGERVLKTAVAAGLSWAVGSLVPGVPRPYFAPLAAILVVQITVAESVSRAIQRVLGVVVGVAVALLMTHLIGLSAWSIGLLVLLSLAAGSLLRLGPTGVPQVAISALLVMIIGSLTGPAYAWARILETVIGAMVGIAVNALLVPRSFLPEARTALQRLSGALAELLRGLASGLAGGLTREATLRSLEDARALSRRIEETRGILHRAEESLKFNLLIRGQGEVLERLKRAFDGLEHASIQIRGISRTLHDPLHRGRPAPPGQAGPGPQEAGPGPQEAAGAAASPVPPELQARLGVLLAAAAQVLDAFWQAVQAPEPDVADLARAAGRARLAGADVEGALPTGAAGSPVAGWVEVGSILADCRRLVADLVALADPGPGGRDAGRR